MSIVTLTSQNQITVPAKVRRELALKPGDKLWFEVGKKANNAVKVRKVVKAEASRGSLAGYGSKKRFDEEGVWTERFEKGSK